MRCLRKSNEHFRRAIGKLPLGVSSNFRYWGEDKTIYRSVQPDGSTYFGDAPPGENPRVVPVD